MPQKLNTFQKEGALALLQVELVLLQTIKYQLQITTMLLHIPTKNKYIIKIDKDTCIKEVKEGSIHGPLEGTRRIAQPHRHNSVLKGAIPRAKRCLKCILRVHRELVVTIPEV